MLDPVRLIVAGLAAYRLAQLVVYDEGPGVRVSGRWVGVFLWLRLRMGVYDMGANGQPRTLRGRLFACPYCVGVYASAVCAGLVLLAWPVTDVIMSIVAVAGLQSAIQAATERGETR